MIELERTRSRSGQNPARFLICHDALAQHHWRYAAMVILARELAPRSVRILAFTSAQTANGLSSRSGPRHRLRQPRGERPVPGPRPCRAVRQVADAIRSAARSANATWRGIAQVSSLIYIGLRLCICFGAAQLPNQVAVAYFSLDN
jgi:hypothetical protein